MREPTADQRSLAEGRYATWSDETVLAAHVGGDRRAFGVLFDRYRDVLFRTVWPVVRHAQDTEDVLQEAFVRAAHRAREFRGEASVATWLHRIAIHAALSHLRVKRRLAEPIDPAAVVWLAAPLGLEPVPAVEDTMVAEAALLALSYPLRETFFLHVQRGFTTREIAGMLGLPPNTVQSRVRRARERLQDILGDRAAGDAQ